MGCTSSLSSSTKIIQTWSAQRPSHPRRTQLTTERTEGKLTPRNWTNINLAGGGSVSFSLVSIT